MKLTNIPLYVIACAFPANAATVNFYSDRDCGNLVQTREVFDNSCAQNNPKYNSIKVTGAGTWGQRLWTYKTAGCGWGTQNGCLTAEKTGKCYKTDGASDGIGSWWLPLSC